MNQLSNTNSGIDYSDNHQVIKTLVEKQIPEDAAEILIGYTRYQAQLNKQENTRNFAAGEDVRTLQSNQQKSDESQSNLATKDDVELAKLELRKEIEEVRSEIKRVELTLRKEIEVVRREIVQASRKTIIWVTTVLLAQTGVVVTLLVNLLKVG